MHFFFLKWVRVGTRRRPFEEVKIGHLSVSGGPDSLDYKVLSTDSHPVYNGYNGF